MLRFTSFILIFFSLVSCQSLEEKATKIHQRVFTIDSHTDTPLQFVGGDFDIGERHNAKNGGGKIDLPRMNEGGLDAAFFAVFLGQGKRDSLSHKEAFNKANEIFDGVISMVEKYPNQAAIALNSQDGYRLEKEEKKAIYLGIENGYALGGNVNNVDYFYNRGNRYITLVHTSNNDLADSSTDKNGEEHRGLSSFGEEVIKRMNELGVMVDVSHASDAAFYDVLEFSKTPVIASHSCARALCDNPRNLDDKMLKTLANNGGVVQMCILSDYVKVMKQSPARDSAKAAFRKAHHDWANYNDEQRKQGLKAWYQLDVDYPPNLATVSDVVDHIDHMVNVAGIDHVGIGTDFDGGGGVADCFDVSELGNITLELVRRGYSEEEIRKIWGGNFMRVFKEVEYIAKK